MKTRTIEISDRTIGRFLFILSIFGLFSSVYIITLARINAYFALGEIIGGLIIFAMIIGSNLMEPN